MHVGTRIGTAGTPTAGRRAGGICGGGAGDPRDCLAARFAPRRRWRRGRLPQRAWTASRAWHPRGDPCIHLPKGNDRPADGACCRIARSPRWLSHASGASRHSSPVLTQSYYDMPPRTSYLRSDRSTPHGVWLLRGRRDQQPRWGAWGQREKKKAKRPRLPALPLGTVPPPPGRAAAQAGGARRRARRGGGRGGTVQFLPLPIGAPPRRPGHRCGGRADGGGCPPPAAPRRGGRRRTPSGGWCRVPAATPARRRCRRAVRGVRLQYTSP